MSRRISRIGLQGRPEGDEEGVILAITQLLQLNGAVVHRVIERIPWGRTTSEAGIPDLFGWWPAQLGINPLHFFIEVKRPGKKLRKAQEKWISDALRAGVVALWADSVEMMVDGFSDFGIKIKGLS